MSAAFRLVVPSLLTLAALVGCEVAEKSDNQAMVDTGALFADDDGDGFPQSEDCNDQDAAIGPNSVEVCDGIDNNCDGQVDENVTQQLFVDDDGDGFGDPSRTVESCTVTSGLVTNANDCDDTNPDIHPSAIEECDRIDNDCDGDIDEDLGSISYADLDGDGWGDEDTAEVSCELPSDRVTIAGDCDDNDDRAHPDAEEVCDEIDNNCDGAVDEGVTSTFYQDLDGDGWGGFTGTTEACALPRGYAADAGDCNDASVLHYPGAREDDCTDPEDYNCDGSVAYADVDADGWPACQDCNDADANIRPDGVEICNEVDDDCDGAIDDDDSSVDLSTGTDFYLDRDGDGYGNPAVTTMTCAVPAGYVDNAYDCDDSSGLVHPSATEICNDIDDDCDGDIDDDDASVDTLTGSPFYADMDSDGFGDPMVATMACDTPSGMVAIDTDCDDTDAAIRPTATEVCDAIDNDCDGNIDDFDADVDLSTGTYFYADADSDGFGNAGDAARSCAVPAGRVADATDCNDSVTAINPAASEVCDTIDNDCDGAIDDADASVDTSTGTRYYTDADGDGYGNASSSAMSCSLPSGMSSNALDCNDGNRAISPSATEICDSIDNDCDSLIDDADTSVSGAPTWYRDSDNDGYGAAASTAAACLQPSGYVSSSSDCNDSNIAINPAATEICDSIDNDCDSAIDDADSSVDLSTGTLYYRDADGDGYGVSSSTTRSCSVRSGYSTSSADCDDGDGATYPGAPETCDGDDNDCDSSSDEGISCAYKLVQSDYSSGLCVDDDLYANLNGSRIYTDPWWGAQCGHVISFNATPGDNLYLWAVDSVGGCRNMSDVYIVQVASGKGQYLTSGYSNTCGHGASSSAFWARSVTVPGAF